MLANTGWAYSTRKLCSWLASEARTARAEPGCVTDVDNHTKGVEGSGNLLAQKQGLQKNDGSYKWRNPEQSK